MAFSLQSKAFIRLLVCFTGVLFHGFLFSQESDSLPVTAGKHYDQVGKFHRLLLGENYRDVWSSKIYFPSFNLEKEGFEILELGGGQQTRSLRLKFTNGHEYSLRSVEKYPAKAVPFILRETITQDIVEDQISASHPFAAVTIPPLAEAIEVFHTNPRYVVIEPGAYLGEYEKEFGGKLALLEERPDDNWREADFFGNSRNIVSTSTMFKRLEKSPENKIDRHAFLRARMLDLLIGDWDRHADQWRWAEYDSGDFKLYVPIPRDRDQAYFVNEGVIPYFVGSRWGLPKVQGFDTRIKNVEGFMQGGLELDRRILGALDRSEWDKTVRYVQERITYETIDQAVSRLPEPAYKRSEAAIIEKLKKRRDDLRNYALKYYDYLADEIDVIGSDAEELFEIHRSETEVEIKVSDRNDPQKVFYQRVFKNDETDVVNIFGMDGEDSFQVEGEAGSSSPVLNLVGGKGKDTITDSSSVSGWRKKTRYYDSKRGFTRDHTSSETNVVSSGSKKKYRYRSDHFKPKDLKPIILPAFDRDRGLSVDLGWHSTTYALFRDPARTQQNFLLNYQIGSENFEGSYTGSYTLVNESLEFITEINPVFNGVSNFFGLGNGTDYIEDLGIDFYRYENLGLNVKLGLRKTISNHSLEVTGTHELINLDNSGSEPVNEIGMDQATPGFFNKRNYSGLILKYRFDNTEGDLLPGRGIRFSTTYKNLWALSSNSSDLKAFSADFTYFKSISKSGKWVFGGRAGYGRNFGGFDFFNAQTLGGLNNLRGIRNSRFSGDQVFYNSVELRVELKNFQTYLFPGTLGLLFFNDTGRVWLDGERSGRWHNGYGGGIWISPLRQSLFVISVATSNDSSEVIPVLSTSFFF